MKKLLREYDLTEPNDYYEMCIASFQNGQIAQAKEQFKALPKSNKKQMLRVLFNANDIKLGLFFLEQL